MRIYTLGYEKKNITEYIDILLSKNVGILIDVREIAWSYKRDFCKVKFSNYLEQAGIEYVHIKALGNPKSIRKNGGSHTEILRKYKSYLKRTNSGISVLVTLFELAQQHNVNVCLTCYEKNFSCCHRSIIIDHINPMLINTSITHL